MNGKTFFRSLMLAVAITAACGTMLLLASAADTRLSNAAMDGNMQTVRTLLQQGADVNAPQGDGTTALHWAAYRDDLAMAQVLLKAGANVKATTRVGAMTPLFMAAKNGSATVLDALLKAGADVNAASSNGTTALMLAAASGKTEAVKILVDRGADVNAKDVTNGQTALMFAAALNRDGAIKVLAEHGADLNVTTKTSPVSEGARGGDAANGRRGRPPVTMGGNTALLYAARDGQINAVQALIAAGANIDKQSTSDSLPPLTQAIITGHFDVAKYLIEHGANPNLASQTNKMTALWATIDSRYAQREWYPPPSTEQEKTSHIELIKILLDHGADINARVGGRAWFRGFGNSGGPDPDGSTAFWRATAALDLETMQLLLSRGADPNMATTHGCSPLTVAAGLQHSHQGANQVPDARMTVVKYLVEVLHADVNSKDDKGYTALHGAALIGQNEVMLYLLDRGADIHARATQISGSGDGGGEAKEAAGGKGDTVADMANGWSMNYPQFPETVTLAMKMGSEFSNTCWASTCVNPTRPDRITDKKRP
jgi:ankyrin repeat protein